MSKFLFNLSTREIQRFTPSAHRTLGEPVACQYWPYDKLKAEGFQGLYATDDSILGWEELLEQAKANRRAETRAWLKCSTEMADNLLNAVPPALHRHGAFACGEEWSHTDGGEGIFLCFRRFDHCVTFCEAQYLTLREFRQILAHP